MLLINEQHRTCCVKITHAHCMLSLQANEHCADGFKCVPSIAFPEYKACRPIVMN
jgi:hypothetical protein